MRRTRRGGLFLAVAAGIAGAGAARAATNAAPAQVAAPIKVLFIGNSLTYCNNLPVMLQSLAGGAPKPLAMEVDAVTKGGAALALHWNRGAALKKIQQGGWTYVVLQDYSTIALTDKKSMFKHVRLFDAEIKKAGAQTLLYMTWALQKAPETQAAITGAYEEIGREIGARVIPVGVAREAALKSNPAAPIYVADGKHPAGAGTYLGACLFYALLSGESPVGLPASVPEPKHPTTKTLVNLSAADAAFYQRIAAETARAAK